MAEQTNNTDMTDQSDRQDLEDRVEQLEGTIAKMLPSRRDALKLGGAALVGGAAMSGSASAGGDQAGTIGSSPDDEVDIESEDITNSDTITTENLVVNQTATGPFGGIIFSDGDPINEFRASFESVSGNSFFDIFNLSAPVDVYGGAVYGNAASALRITFDSNNVVQVGSIGDNDLGVTNSGGGYTVQPIFPMESVKRLEVTNDAGSTSDYGYQVYTT